MDATTADKAGDDSNKTSVQANLLEKQTAPTVEEIEDAPDPDEDDLDDLDDMLEEFSSTKLSSNQAAAQPGPGPGVSSAGTSSAPNPNLSATDAGSGFTADGLENLSEEEFEKQLQAGMAELMNDLENSVSIARSRY